MITTSMEEVLQQMDRLLEVFRKEHNRMGYFAGLYRIVAATFKEAIEQRVFANTALMKRLNTRFFNRYLQAITQYRRGDAPTRAWLVSFEAAKSRKPIVLQHLLMGINAHIHLDLGISLSRACPAMQLEDAYPDFYRMNAVLGSLVEEIKIDLTRVLPGLSTLEQMAGKLDDRFSHFGLRYTREHAWRFAQELSIQTPQAQASAIATMDEWVASVGRTIESPSLLLRPALSMVRLSERGSIPEIIDLLAHKRDPTSLLERIAATEFDPRPPVQLKESVPISSPQGGVPGNAHQLL